MPCYTFSCSRFRYSRRRRSWPKTRTAQRTCCLNEARRRLIRMFLTRHRTWSPKSLAARSTRIHDLPCRMRGPVPGSVRSLESHSISVAADQVAGGSWMNPNFTWARTLWYPTWRAGGERACRSFRMPPTANWRRIGRARCFPLPPGRSTGEPSKESTLARALAISGLSIPTRKHSKSSNCAKTTGFCSKNLPVTHPYPCRLSIQSVSLSETFGPGQQVTAVQLRDRRAKGPSFPR